MLLLKFFQRTCVTMKLLIRSIPLIALTLYLLACDTNDTSKPQAKSLPTVVATTGMIADVVRELSAGQVEVVTLIGAGVDPHLFKATRDDIVKLTTADLVFSNGLLLEGKMTEALDRVAQGGGKVVAVAEQIAPSELIAPVENSAHYDPHVWMDPLLWSETAPIIATGLSELLPTERERIVARAVTYQARLKKLAAYTKAGVSTIPDTSRVLVTAHDAFSYFGKRFALEVIGVQGISTDSEAGLKDIETIVETLVGKKIAAVFIESTVAPKNVQALIEGAKALGHDVNIGGELFSDAMGEVGTPQGTYIGMIEHNVRSIVQALGGRLPSPSFAEYEKTPS
jgi:manganese/zinc/iron transport system substrate-binding protein